MSIFFFSNTLKPLLCPEFSVLQASSFLRLVLEFWGPSNRTLGKALAWQATDLGLIPGTSYGSLSTTGCAFRHQNKIKRILSSSNFLFIHSSTIYETLTECLAPGLCAFSRKQKWTYHPVSQYIFNVINNNIHK